MTLVTVIVPAYNSAPTISATLDSIRAQDWRDLEIVVIDDGSTDQTAAIAHRHAAEDARIRVVRQPNAGVSAARNHALRVTRGRFVSPCDADDIWHPQRVSKLMRRMEELGPDTGYVYSPSRIIDEQDRVTGQKGIAGFEGATYLRSLVLNFVGNGSAILIRREALEDVGGYTTELTNSADWHLQVMIARRWKVGCVPEFLTGYRILAGGLSRDGTKMKRSAVEANDLFARAYPETRGWIHDAVSAMHLARLAVVHLRYRRLADAASAMARALSLSPRAAIDTAFLTEGPRLLRKAASRLRPKVSGGVPGPLFSELDPAVPFGDPDVLVLPWLVERIAPLEDRFFVEGPTARRPGSAPDPRTSGPAIAAGTG